MAEIGVNHDGDVDRARELIDGAAEAGFDAVKFQYWIIDELLAAHAPVAEYQGSGDQHDLLASLSLTLEELAVLSEHARQRDVAFVCTADGERALADVLTLEPAVLKIGSGDNDNPWLLDAVAAAGLPTLISTGMTSGSELERILRPLAPLPELVVLHCVSAYPAPLADAGLARIPDIARMTNRPVGLSDHTLGVAAAVAAIALGACVIEKHVTWSLSAPGPDHAASLAITDSAEWVTTLRDVATALTDAPASPDEAANKPLVRKALYAAVDLDAGAAIRASDVVPLRPVLDGIPALERSNVLGRRLVRALPAGTLLRYGDLVEP
jgi:N-acetylneuraminate synthase/N,N'-diacetyllegionaminate synthase